MTCIFIIEDDPIMAECLAHAVYKVLLSKNKTHVKAEHQIKIFSNNIDAINTLSDTLPDLILLDVLPSGPDAFSLLNELISYSDTSKIPVILITSLPLSASNLAHYGIISILNKETMTPDQVSSSITEALGNAE